MSPCLIGGTTYNLTLDLIKHHTPSSSSSSSSYSTLCECIHSSISTRKARTRRKRPNQAYHEAALILSTAYPKLFTAKDSPRPEYTKSLDERKSFLLEASDLLVPSKSIDNSADLLQTLERPDFRTKHRNSNSIENPQRVAAGFDASEELCQGHEENFSTQRILYEEIGEGIDCVMGKLSMETENIEDPNNHAGLTVSGACCYGHPVGLGFGFEMGMRNELRAMRNVHGDGDLWRYPAINLADLTPKIAEIPVDKKTKKKENLGSGKRNKAKADLTDLDKGKFGRRRGELLLKLNYDGILNAWSGRGSPFCDGVGGGARRR